MSLRQRGEFLFRGQKTCEGSQVVARPALEQVVEL
jgi:hypothetical protein